MSRYSKKIRLSTIIKSLLAIFVLLALFFGILIYWFNFDGKSSRIAIKMLPYPAAIISNTNFVSVSELKSNLDAVKKFYENQDFSDTGFRVDFNTPEGKNRLKIKERKLLNKLIENKVVEIVAKKKGITLSMNTIEQELKRKMNEYGTGDELAGNLKKLYGWNVVDFEREIVMPDMYRQALQKYISEDDSQELEAKNKINKAKAELGNKADFIKTVEKYSEGESAKNDGSLGWFSADQMAPELATATFSLEKGKISEVIRSNFGYHIIRLEDKKTENNVEKVKISQIFVKAESFSEWLQNQEKGIKIYIPLRSYYFDKNSGSVKFQDQNLKDFENNLNKNSAGDISVLF